MPSSVELSHAYLGSMMSQDVLSQAKLCQAELCLPCPQLCQDELSRPVHGMTSPAVLSQAKLSCVHLSVPSCPELC